MKKVKMIRHKGRLFPAAMFSGCAVVQKARRGRGIVLKQNGTVIFLKYKQKKPVFKPHFMGYLLWDLVIYRASHFDFRYSLLAATGCQWMLVADFLYKGEA